MRIEIDTKEDLHNIKHIMRLLQAISMNASGKYSSFEDTSNMFSETSSSSSSSPVPETPSGIFNMFDSPSSSPSSSTPDIFQGIKKDEDKNKDFLDSLQVY